MAKALVVDDSRAIRTILTKTMAGCGFEVCQASNGHEAMQLLERECSGITIVLCDWHMPEMDGLQFVKEMRSDRRFASILVMMVTTETNMEQMAAAFQAGANEYVMKPFTSELIADKLRLLGLVQ